MTASRKIDRVGAGRGDVPGRTEVVTIHEPYRDPGEGRPVDGVID